MMANLGPDPEMGDDSGGFDPGSAIVNGTPTSGFPSVGMVGDTSGMFCTGTLVAPQYVLTAGHCADGVGNTAGRFRLGSTTYSTSQVIVHPSYDDNAIGLDTANDIAIYRLNQAVSGVTPSPIYRNTPQVGQLLTLVGFGAGGTGNSGHDGSFGTKRVGTTRIDQVSSKLIHWNFDNNNEANTAPGDSGGPAFLQVDGNYLVAGVTSGGDQANAGIGDHSFDTRVDAYQSWIDSIVGSSTLPMVRVTASDAQAAETNSGQVANPGTLTISRTGSTTSALTVNFSVTGSATPGSDYTSLPNSVTIPAGQLSLSLQVMPINDALVETTENALLTLSGNANYTLDSAATSATVSIADNDSPSTSVGVQIVDGTAAETRSGQTANFGVVRLSRSGNMAAPLTVQLAHSGTAIHGTDYTGVSTTATIPAGQSSVDLLLRPIDDNRVEGTETAVLTVRAGAYGVLAGQSTATVQILDNDTATSNDHFAGRILLIGSSALVSGSNTQATRETGEPNNAGVSGGKSVWWTWTAPTQGFVVLTTAGSSFDTTLGVYTGTSVNALTRVASNDDEDYFGGVYTSEVFFSAVAGRTYQFLVDGYDGDSGNIRLGLSYLGNRGSVSPAASDVYFAANPSMSDAWWPLESNQRRRSWGYVR